MDRNKMTWYEFFAGGGMARLGLGEQWHCLFANDFSTKKAAAYRAAFGENGIAHELRVEDVRELRVTDLPGVPDLVWASFPCQDLSLAGNGAGLDGHRSGMFSPFWELVRELAVDGRKPQIVVLENVVGAITSHGGRDFQNIICKMTSAGYSVGAVVIDAVLFVPQSRPRLFVVAVDSAASIPKTCSVDEPNDLWHPANLVKAYEDLPASLKRNWIWWTLPEPTARVKSLASLIEDVPTGIRWHVAFETKRLIGMMSPLNLRKVRQAQALSEATGERLVGTVYKRTRPVLVDGVTRKVQRAELRFDDISGCLRTPAGGSSRQIIFAVEGKSVRSRLLSTKEAARLMGVPEDYPIPANYNDGYHLFGDGLVVPAVAWLDTHILQRIAKPTKAIGAA
jgi:DNA (cytosine-5)-methyltransferase 1